MPTGEHPVVKAELKRELNLNELKTIAAIFVAAVGTFFGAYRVVLGEARAQTDAGVSLQAQKLAITDADLQAFKRDVTVRFERYENQGNRTEKKMDALLDRFNVPNPAPAPKDGGQ